KYHQELARCLDPVNNAFVLQNVAGFTEVIANVRLLSDPVDVTRDACAEIDGWLVTGRPRQRGVAGEMTHFPGPKFPVDLRCDIYLQNVGKLFRDFANWCAAGATNIYGQSIELVGFDSEQIRAGNVLDERKIPRLFAVFVQNRPQIIQQTCAKNRNHSGVRIEDRLARPVRAGVTKRDCGNTDLLSPEQHESLLINFRQAVNGFPPHRCPPRRGKTLCDRSANRAVHLPIAATQLLDRGGAWKDPPVLRTFARAVAVNGL